MKVAVAESKMHLKENNLKLFECKSLEIKSLLSS